MQPGLLTTDQVARRLGVSVSSVNRWAKVGRIDVAFRTPGLRGANLFTAAAVLDMRDRLEARKKAS